MSAQLANSLGQRIARSAAATLPRVSLSQSYLGVLGGGHGVFRTQVAEKLGSGSFPPGGALKIGSDGNKNADGSESESSTSSSSSGGQQQQHRRGNKSGVDLALVQKMLMGGCLWASGELLTQLITADNEAVKDRRGVVNPTPILHSFIVGGLFFTPLANFWYVRADRLFPLAAAAAPSAISATGGAATSSMHQLPTILKKVAFDQSVFTLAVLTTVFSSFSLLQGNSLRDARDKVVKEVPPTLPMNWAVWAPVQFLNFLWVPANKRIYLVNVVTVPWTGYLAWKAK